MIKVSTTGMAVSLKTDLRFPISGQWGHGDRIIHREARIILISSWKNGFISSHNEKNTPQIKELEAQLDRYGIRIVGKVCDNRYRDYAVRDYLKEHPSIKEYVVVDDDIKEYSSKDIPHLRLVDSKVGFR